MSTVSFVRTSPISLGEDPHSDASVCVSCGSFLAEEQGTSVSGGYHNPLSLDTLLVRHPNATYFVQVGMNDEAVIQENAYLGVRTGDILVVDRALAPTVGCLVLAVHENEMVLCRYTEHESKRFLVCGDKKCKPIELGAEGDSAIWGVVSALSRRL